MIGCDVSGDTVATEAKKEAAASKEHEKGLEKDEEGGLWHYNSCYTRSLTVW